MHQILRKGNEAADQYLHFPLDPGLEGSCFGMKSCSCVVSWSSVVGMERPDDGTDWIGVKVKSSGEILYLTCVKQHERIMLRFGSNSLPYRSHLHAKTLFFSNCMKGPC